MNDEPIHMFNALWFKPEGGAEQYKQYLAATYQVIQELQIGAKMLDGYKPEAVIIGDSSDWDPDLFFVVEYPSQAAFDRMVNSEAFQQVKPLREAAIEKSLLVRCKRP